MNSSWSSIMLILQPYVLTCMQYLWGEHVMHKIGHKHGTFWKCIPWAVNCLQTFQASYQLNASFISVCLICSWAIHEVVCINYLWNFVNHICKCLLVKMSWNFLQSAVCMHISIYMYSNYTVGFFYLGKDICQWLCF